MQSEIEEADETALLFGVANRGVSFIDAANPGSLPSSVPAFALPPAAQPSDGSATGGTPVTFSGHNFESSAVVVFSGQPAANASLSNGNQIQLSAPANVASGGTVVTVRGSGFVSAVTATVGGKSAAVTFVDASTIAITSPPVTAGPQRLTLANPIGETTSLDAAFIAN